MDADELAATLEGFRAEQGIDRDAMQAELTELSPAERREAMRRIAEERRAAMAEALGVDAEVLAGLHERAGHRAQDGPHDGRVGGRMGGGMGGGMGLDARG